MGQFCNLANKVLKPSHHTLNSGRTGARGGRAGGKGRTKSKIMIRERKAMSLESPPAGRGLTVAAPSGGFPGQNPPAAHYNNQNRCDKCPDSDST